MLPPPSKGAGPDKVFNTTKRLSAQILLFLMLVASIALLVSAMAFQQRQGQASEQQPSIFRQAKKKKASGHVCHTRLVVQAACGLVG